MVSDVKGVGRDVVNESCRKEKRRRVISEIDRVRALHVKIWLCFLAKVFVEPQAL
jgi:hypothetical protein